jgi:magnesium chelatase family protein
MTLAIVYSRATVGIRAPLITVETHLSKGLPRFNIVGLPETVVKESKDRVRSALLNSQFKFPRGRITINLAPADLPKEDSRFDLPIALGILAASKQIPQDKIAAHEFIGELALSGELRAVYGVLPVVLGVKDAKRTLIVPLANADEAAFIQGKEAHVFSAKHLLDVCAYLQGLLDLDVCKNTIFVPKKSQSLDLSDVCGQGHAKRALEIAAAGKHSLLLIGPPGTGKTMLASRIATILPDISEKEALEIAAIASISRKGFNPAEWQVLPFRAPHHSASLTALVGGGRPPRPGEISLAHQGVLFLDELPEFNRQVLESLREPLELGSITISRAAYQATFPAAFQLITAMNPCPCGYAGSAFGNCRCTSEQVDRYWAKLSGPLLDRIDMQVEVPNIPLHTLSAISKGEEESATVKTRVVGARLRQLDRQFKCNQDLMTNDIQQFCQLSSVLQNKMQEVVQQFHLSARAYHRILKVARTIADLAGDSFISEAHLSEAIMYRRLGG